MRLRGAETGREYDALGRDAATLEPGLAPLPGYNQFWFAWSVFNHGSEVFAQRTVATAPIEQSDDCAVPCDEIVLGCSGQDCIPALTDPVLVQPGGPDTSYLQDESFVVGISLGGEARAYPHNILWWHEIMNDTIGDAQVAVTHCPLTFSTIAHDRTGFHEGAVVDLGVSGRLYNSNLVFYDRSDGSKFSQLLGIGTEGPLLGQPAPRIHTFEMTWRAWRAFFPDSTVLSDQTGHARNYERYPYGSYFTDDSDTFRATNPAPDPLYAAKDVTYGLRIDGGAKAWVHDELAAWAAVAYGAEAGPRGVLNDSLAGSRVALVFDLDAGYVQAFSTEEDLEWAR